MVKRTTIAKVMKTPQTKMTKTQTIMRQDLMLALMKTPVTYMLMKTMTKMRRKTKKLKSSNQVKYLK